jgi:hypothetical protein
VHDKDVLGLSRETLTSTTVYSSRKLPSVRETRLAYPPVAAQQEEAESKEASTHPTTASRKIRSKTVILRCLLLSARGVMQGPTKKQYRKGKLSWRPFECRTWRRTEETTSYHW